MRTHTFRWSLAIVFASPVTLWWIIGPPGAQWGGDVRVDIIALAAVVIFAAGAILAAVEHRIEQSERDAAEIARTIRGIEIFVNDDLRRSHGDPRK